MKTGYNYLISNCEVAFGTSTRLSGRKGIRPVKEWGMVEVGTG